MCQRIMIIGIICSIRICIYIIAFITIGNNIRYNVMNTLKEGIVFELSIYFSLMITLIGCLYIMVIIRDDKINIKLSN